MIEPLGFFLPNILVQVVSLALFVIVAVTVSSVRHEPDAKGRRLTATYLAVVMFAALFTALAAATVAVGSLSSLVGDDTGESRSVPSLSPEGDVEGFLQPDDYDDDEEGNEDEVGSAVQAVLLAGVAGGVLLYHRRRTLQLIKDEGADAHEEGQAEAGPARRVVHGYLYASQAVAILTLVVGASIGLYGFAKVIVPDALSTEEASDARDEGARDVFTGGFLAVASLGIVRLHEEERERMDEDDADDVPEPPDEQETPEYPIA